MKEKHYQMIGLTGFIIAGLLFVLVGLNTGDMLTITASIIWTLSCIVWMIPLVYPPQKSK